MKLANNQADAFIARPRPEVALVLLYGQDAGLVQERTKRLALKIVPALDDPFQVSELDPDLLEQEPARLIEEAQALCLMGGRRLVRVRAATDKITPACQLVTATKDVAGFVVVEAGELGGGSRLRRLVEGAANAAGIACYRDEKGLAGLIRERLAAESLRVEAEALAYLNQHLGGDRAVTLSELDKLALYMQDQPGRVVTFEDAAAVVGDSAAVEIDEAVSAALTGERTRLERALDRLFDSGAEPIALLRSCSRLLLQALRLKAELGGGKPLEAALAPIHFRSRDLMRDLVRGWPLPRLITGLGRLQEAELRCKSARAPSALICREVMAGLGSG